MYSIEPISLHTEGGFDALAFALPDMLRKFGGRIREISIDSTWHTNGANYELYAVLGEVYGSGLPLGFLLLQSNGSGDKGAKARFLSEFLGHLKKKWTILPKITLSDKDLSEIHAMREQFPEAKHQLCFWHALRAIKKRLATLRRAPAPYNVTAARKKYHWITEDFVPAGQSPVPLVCVSASRIPTRLRAYNACSLPKQHIRPRPLSPASIFVSMVSFRRLQFLPHPNDLPSRSGP
ncbi:hypothetical protein OBBRIDRAFT_739561 [Obba rivulosa]|uniref:MULE transposase domain-containing protein n=1 Tax=Obba rivulosa TaxID=1052685 RepID=A0A8E2DH96_9APHY|nr:hypothetical protein OBBRIDRAFT_739561 [Obba rivulosa]